MSVNIRGLSFYSEQTTQIAKITLSEPINNKTIINEFDFGFVNSVNPFDDPIVHIIITDFKQNDYIVLYSCYETTIGNFFLGSTESAWILHRNHEMDPRSIDDIEKRLLKSTSDSERAESLLIWTWNNSCNDNYIKYGNHSSLADF